MQLYAVETVESCRDCRAVETVEAVEGAKSCPLVMCMALFEVHPQGRCPMTSVVIKGVHIGISMPCTVIPPSRGRLFRKASALLSDGVPPTHWVVHQGWYHVIV